MRQVICKECGKQFYTNHSRKKYCDDDHYRTCEICGKQFYVPKNKLSLDLKTCSEICRREAIRNYTYECVCKICGSKFQSKNKLSNICEGVHFLTCKYCGKDFIATKQQIISNTKTCSNECRYKLSELTNEKKTGYKQVFSNPEIRERIKQTNLEKYGVDNPRKNENIKLKYKKTCLDKYGVEYPSQSEEIKTKQKKTFRKNYGVDWGLQSNYIKEKSKQTCLEKYGVDNYSKSLRHISSIITDPSKAEQCNQFRSNPKQFIEDNFKSYKPTLVELSNMCGIRDSSVGHIIINNHCESLVNYVFSKMEIEVYQFLCTLIDSSKIERNTFKVITPYELDLYLPEYKIGIECNPTSTHNSSFGGWSSNDEPKPRKYHQMKTDLCEEKGIFLFHIFGYEWTYKQEVIKSMIRNIIKQNDNKIHARKCKIVYVNDYEASMFQSINHRQTVTHAKINIGLMYKDELVSLMTFGKMRSSIGTGSEDLSDCYELVRFCSKLNTTVVGGASKLFKYFLKKYNPERIRSFSDRAHTKGNLYKTLGFNQIRSSDPGYVWVDTRTDQSFSRMNAQKHNIQKFLKDENIDLRRTEFEIMEEHGYASVFDSGTITWEFVNT